MMIPVIAWYFEVDIRKSILCSHYIWSKMIWKKASLSVYTHSSISGQEYMIQASEGNPTRNLNIYNLQITAPLH